MPISEETVKNVLSQIDYDYTWFEQNERKMRPILEGIAVGQIDADENVRKNAISVLGRVGNDRSVNKLLDLVESENPDYRLNAVRSLGRIGTDRATAALQERLDEGTMSVTDELAIVESLAVSGQVESADAIRGFRDRFIEDFGREHTAEIDAIERAITNLEELDQ